MHRFDRLINHPGRKQTLQYINYICIAATPPSKGEPAPLRRGETYSDLHFNPKLKLTVMSPAPMK